MDMTAATWSAVLGTAAALCTTLAFLPQLIAIRKGRNAELSASMLGIYLAGLGLWLVYGLLIHAVPVIASNIASAILVSAVALRKWAAARDASRGAAGAPGRRLRIAIDMDEVMADALGEHLRRYNRAFDARLSAGDLRGRHLEDVVPAAHREAVESMLDASFFADLTLMPDCQEVVRELASRHDVYIVTAAMDVPCSFDAKFAWLQRHFPFIPASQVVFCGDKGVIDADYLIDDRPQHFPRFKGRPLLYSAPHNVHETRYPRVGSWQEVRATFAALDGPGASRVAALARQPAAA